MSKILFLLIFIIDLPTHTMLSMDKMPFDLPELLPEIQSNIIHFTIITEKTPKGAIRMVGTLCSTSKEFFNKINTPTYTDNLIKELGKKYHCSDETIAKRLQIEAAKDRLILQDELKKLCLSPIKNHTLQKKLLTELIAKKVDLEFTYNHCHHQKTPLMLAISCGSHIFEDLVDCGVNINTCNSYGMTALHLACKNQQLSHITKLITNSKIAINQKNHAGENALLYYFTHKKWLTKRHTTICSLLLQAGSDPDCTNKKGQTPLFVLKAIHKLPNNHPLIILISAAIKLKYAPNRINA